MKRWQRIACLGCLIVALSGILTLGGCTVLFFQSTQREPELPIRQFLRKQREAFPSDWVLEEEIVIWTDTDFTWASWAAVSNFWYKDGVRISPGIDLAQEEIHVFRNAFVARITSYPSPSSLSAAKGYIPQGWSYRPPHADRFEFGCRGGDGSAQPEWCGFIVRYEEYIIIFDTPIASYMTLKDLQRIMEVIDREMADYLKRSTLRPGPRLVPTAIP
ncbi:MAG: hypothetical protein ACPLYD_16260 [Anaerolineae bacterium]